MTDDDRRCAMGVICRDFTVEQGRRQAALLTTPRGLCDACRRWARRCVRDMPHDWCKLKLTIGESRIPAGDKTRHQKPGSKVPLNVAGDALMRDIVDLANEAAEVVSDALGITRGRTGHTRRGWSTSSRQDYRLIDAAAALVAENVPKLIADDDGPAIARRIILLHRRAVKHLGETAQRERQHLPCPFCGGVIIKEIRDLRGRESHAGVQTPEVIRCTSCDSGPNRDGTWTEAEYRWLSTMVLTEREEIEVLKWLLAEAQWKRDVNAWLAAERQWALEQIARAIGVVDVETLLDQVRQSVNA